MLHVIVATLSLLLLAGVFSSCPDTDETSVPSTHEGAANPLEVGRAENDS